MGETEFCPGQLYELTGAVRVTQAMCYWMLKLGKVDLDVRVLQDDDEPWSIQRAAEAFSELLESLNRPFVRMYREHERLRWSASHQRDALRLGILVDNMGTVMGSLAHLEKMCGCILAYVKRIDVVTQQLAA
ncbi:MAG: hypothetical protein ABIO72_05250 [Patescibacteria group bacterium]